MSKEIKIANEHIEATARVESTGLVYLHSITLIGEQSPPYSADGAGHRNPIVELSIDGEGNHGAQMKPSKGLAGGSSSLRLLYGSHEIKGGTLSIALCDQKSGAKVTCTLELVGRIVRSCATIENSSSATFTVNKISSLSIGAVTPKNWRDEYTISLPHNSWFREAQWSHHSLPDLGVDDIGLDLTSPRLAQFDSMAYTSLSNRSTFSTQGYLPMGMLKSSTDLWLWQIENNGAWRWDVGDKNGKLYIVTSGPEAVDHEWRLDLQPGDTYTTPATGLFHGSGSMDEAFGAMSEYRRAIIRPHPDYDTMPIIFNDYMNCLMGDPADQKILALLPAVAKSGAEYFVIDAGWYADDGDWWEDVGEWDWSRKRFPMGFKELLSKIQEAGLKPGLWLEPEVIGIKSKVADELPFEAFMQRGGHRLAERGRYHLDFRHPSVISRMDRIVDKLVIEYGARYFKFDYNIEHSLGTDIDCSSPGVGQQGHGQAYLGWIRGLLDRHPGLVLENCSSGGQRMEYDMLGSYTLQSTSDQMDPALYAAISAALPTAVLPEQGATWAYPQLSWSDEINALIVANALLGRIHLSGRLDRLSGHQLEDIVCEGMRVYSHIRMDLRRAVPFWPLGLPKWHDSWLALGMKVDETRAYLTVWRRGGSEEVVLPMRKVKATLLYPRSFQAESKWEEGGLRVRLEADTCARLFELHFA